MQEFLERVLQQSKEAQQRYLELEQRIRQNSQDYQEKTATFKEEMRIICEENDQLAARRA